ncbi:NAD(P)H dehydrogenase (quinone) [Alicyclobacillus cellulosilyticus]|uniref:NAD(P)H dehydrogenase (Quinone) n=1 Tax=Alicyclobacillus cellulosilyticus TaxID=1003997 RepID=A0A917KGI3_9BACL|nr:NAD(P)H:quinone oxidoreductase type IV [Alicyclobacillus cellulosilyticus]GGJ13295.1 NAD(P)H dehydrogenase (quinone) [Alicyclobacillus cellulosilyticus]
MANILVVYYSLFGHIYEMAKAAVEGARQIGTTTVKLSRIPDFKEYEIPPQLLSSKQNAGTHCTVDPFKTGERLEKYERNVALQNSVPIASLDDLRWADGVIWGFPGYYGMMPSQVKLFLDMAGEACREGWLEGKPAGVLTSAGSIHAGHETTILTSIVPLLHFGMIFVGSPYTENPEYLTDEALGGTPYGPSTLAGPDSSRIPDPRELLMAARLGRRVALVAEALQTNFMY